jgi:hypothetical protein
VDIPVTNQLLKAASVLILEISDLKKEEAKKGVLKSG